ncbi:hypothetical protein BY996DRAFT_6445827 [Phakopsora pachyrhizi]|nr:hypothetical protein BY996DRAFT_6445827 [Phakopsora pachyrhizi]
MRPLTYIFKATNLPKLHVGDFRNYTEEVKGNRTAEVEGSDAVGTMVTGGGRPAGSTRPGGGRPAGSTRPGGGRPAWDTEIYSRRSARESRAIYMKENKKNTRLCHMICDRVSTTENTQKVRTQDKTQDTTRLNRIRAYY